MKNQIFITQEQLDKLSEELQYYIHTKRPEVVERIKEAKSYGDLSENSEYDSAREEQAFVEAKIKELEAQISNAQLIDENIESDVVALGTTVTYENIKTKEKSQYRIVGIGANPLDEKTPSISSSTPIARGLSGKAIGEEVLINIPDGHVTLKILDIK